jgi:hypothetical protein
LFIRITKKQMRLARGNEEIEIPSMNASVEDHIGDISTDGID